MFELRNQNRYGRYLGVCDKLGKCIFEISICGWFEKFVVYKKGKCIAEGETDEECEAGSYEDDDGYYVWCNSSYSYIKINKPLGKCIKKFK